MKNKITKNFRIEKELWSKFRGIADEHGYSASGAIRIQIIKFIKEMEATNNAK